MKNSMKLVLAGLTLSSFLLCACEGPAEKQGKEIDKKVEAVQTPTQDTVSDTVPAQKADETVDGTTGS